MKESTYLLLLIKFSMVIIPLYLPMGKQVQEKPIQLMDPLTIQESFPGLSILFFKTLKLAIIMKEYIKSIFPFCKSIMRESTI